MGSRWLILLLLTGCADVGKGIDRVCVKGKLTEVEAALLTRLGAVPDDRIVNKECSELLRALTGRD